MRTDLLPAGDFHATIDSITFPNGSLYKFSFEQVGSVWRAYILHQPSYGSRGTGLHATHRRSDGNRYFVCWEPEPTSYAALRTICDQWARRTERYIKSGTPIEK
jgi:hypothetical protein